MSPVSNTYRFVFGFIVSFAVSSAASTSFAESGYGYGYSAGGSYASSNAYGYNYGHASTAAEGFLRGRAAVIDALGNFQVNAGQAAILNQQARDLDRENDLKQTAAVHAQIKMWDDARYQVRKDREARAAEGRKLLAEKRATVFSQVYRLPASELNLNTGAINWPTILRDARFQQNRERLEELFREHVSYGGSHAETAREIARSVDQLARSLRSEIGSMPREEYLAAQKFLLGLKYGAESLVQPS